MKKEVMVQKAEQLFDAVKNVKVGLGDAKHGMLLAGKYLMKINTEKLWKADGSPSKSFAHWVEMELSLSKSTCYNLMDAYAKVGELIENNAHYKDIDMSKVFLLLPYIKDDASLADKEEILEMAQSCTWRGLQDNLKNMKGKKASDECDHEETETFVRCKKCRSWLKD
jgi:hypothetical protein